MAFNTSPKLPSYAQIAHPNLAAEDSTVSTLPIQDSLSTDCRFEILSNSYERLERNFVGLQTQVQAEIESRKFQVAEATHKMASLQT
jgi:hypothetical protein